MTDSDGNLNALIPFDVLGVVMELAQLDQENMLALAEQPGVFQDALASCRQLWATSRIAVSLLTRGFGPTASEPHPLLIRAVAYDPTIPVVIERLNDDEISGIAALVGASNIHIRRGDLTNAGVKQLTRMFPNLTHLALERCTSVDDEGILAITDGLPGLESLNVSTTKMTSAGLKHLIASPCCQTLRSLCVSRCPLEGRFLLGLARFKSLEVLDMSGVGSSQFADPQIVGALNRLSNLRRLDFGGCSQLTDEALTSLTELSRLRILDVSGCVALTDATIDFLVSHVPHLEHLALIRCKAMTQRGFQALANFTGLQHLDVSWCTQAALAIPSWGPLKELRHLDLLGCGIHDESLQWIAQHHRKLQTLGMMANMAVTNDGMMKLLALPPGLELSMPNRTEVTTESTSALMVHGMKFI